MAVALVVALAFSALITAFITFIINPLVARLQGGKKIGLGWLLRSDHNPKTFVDLGGADRRDHLLRRSS